MPRAAHPNPKAKLRNKLRKARKEGGHYPDYLKREAVVLLKRGLVEGLTLAGFAAYLEISPGSISKWVKDEEMAVRGKKKAKGPGTLTEVKIQNPFTSTGLTIVLPTGIRVEGCSEDFVLAIVKELL